MSEQNSPGFERSTFAVGARPNIDSLRGNGPDTVKPSGSRLPLNDPFDAPLDRGALTATKGLPVGAPPAYTAIGSNGQLMHGVHFQPHDHFHRHQHRDKPSAGAPSIAGISDVAQSTGHHSDNTATIKNAIPTMIGFGHAGDVVLVFDGKSQIGSTIIHTDGTWVFTTPALLNGRHDFSVGVIDPVNGGMLTSNHLAVQVFAQAPPAPVAVATITSALDEFIDPNGIHHDNVIQNGGKTFDTSPKLLGTLDAALHAGETLVVYRDGVKLELADVSGLGWSFQDTGVAAGEHTYSARVESAAGGQGAISGNFAIVETAPMFNGAIPMMATEDFLIFDTRGVSRTQSNGSPISFDLLEVVSTLEKAGMTVKSYTEKDGFISIEVDWISYVKTHPDSHTELEFVSHQHVDNDKGGLDYYEIVSVPLVYSENIIGKWIPNSRVADGFVQPASPPAASHITGIYDVSTDESGNTVQSLIPDGGSTANSTHKIVLTFSEPLSQGWISDSWALYRDGVRVWPSVDHKLEAGYDQATNTRWVIDTDVSPGAHVYTAQVLRKYGEQGAWSQSYSIVETGPAPVAVATITSALDEFIDPNGNHHDQVIQNGGKTADTSPQLHGTLNTALHEGEVLAIYRDGQKIGTASVTGLGWSYQDEGLTTGQHVYTASVVSASGEQGVHSEDFLITETAGTHEPAQEPLAGRMLLNDHLLVIDTGILNHTNADGSVASVQMRAELTLAGGTIAVFQATVDGNGTASFEADWAQMIAAHPNATLTITAHDNVNQSDQVVDKHVIGTLAGQIGHWVTAIPDGESAAFFSAADRSVHIHGNAGINTITVSDDHQLIDLTSLTGKTTGSTITGIERIDLGGQHNTLKIAMIDVLNLGETDLFRTDGKQQLMVNGKAADAVELSNTRVAGIADGDWERQGNATIGGVAYDVYEHSTAHVELMVQQGVQLSMH